MRADNENNDRKIIGGFEDKEQIVKLWKSPPGKWCQGGCDTELSELNVTEGRFSLHMASKPKKQGAYIGYYFKDRDLTLWETLKADIFNAWQGNVKLEGFWQVPLKDNPDKYKRFFFAVVLKPGKNAVSLRLPDNSSPADWTKVDFIQFFKWNFKEEVDLYFDNIRLEKSTSGDGDSKSTLPSEAAVKPGSEDKFTDKVRETSVLPLKKLSSKPEIDGEIDDPAWKGAARIDGFVNTFTGKPVTEKTIAYAGYDDDGFYFAFDCKESQINKLHKKVTRNDFHLFGDDCLEIFLEPGQVPGRYYHFMVNPIATRQDEVVVPGNVDINWTKQWHAKTRIGNDKWTVEVFIPFYVFEYPAASNLSWKINLCRSQRPKGELSALFPTFGGFHAEDKFGKLTGVNVDFRKYFYDFKNLIPGSGKLGNNDFTFDIDNNTPAATEMYIDLATEENSRITTAKNKVYTLRKGLNRIDLPYQVEKAEDYPIYFKMADTKSGKTVYESSPQQVTPPLPITFIFKVPCYKNCIFATQKIEKIRGEVHLNIQDLLGKASITAGLYDEKKQILEEKTYPVQNRMITVDFSAGNLQYGRYTVKISFRDKNQKLIASSETGLRKLKPRANEVRIDENGNILIDNQPFFLLGMWYGPVGGQELKEAGFNTAFLIQSGSPERYKASFEAAAKSDYYIISHIDEIIQGTHSKEKPFSTYRKTLEDFCSGVQVYPRLLSYSTLDEPNCFFPVPRKVILTPKKLLMSSIHITPYQ
ncbi:MAG: hypothetical protein PHV82_06615 [Victivallaceae bacterium]|nr:hypothetical protein [Victivallaceae bacterium]